MITYHILQHISIHGSLDSLLASDFSFDPDVNKKFYQVLWINPPIDKDVLAGDKKASTISITYQYGVDNNGAHAKLITKDFDAADNIKYNANTQQYYNTNNQTTSLLKADIVLETGISSIDFKKITTVLNVNMPVYYSIKEVSDTNADVVNINDVTNLNYLKFYSAADIFDVSSSKCWTPFDSNIQLVNVETNPSKTKFERPVKVLTNANTAYSLNIGIRLVSSTTTAPVQYSGTIIAKPDYYVGYIIDDRLTTKKYVKTTRNGYAYIKSDNSSVMDIDYKLNNGVVIKNALLDINGLNYLLNTGYKIRIDYSIDDITLKTYTYTMNSNSIFGLKQTSTTSKQTTDLNKLSEKAVETSIKLAEQDLQKYVINADYVTPMEYYANRNNENTVNYDAMIDTTGTDTNDAEPVYFWVETLKNWCTYSFETVTDVMVVAKLKMWNGHDRWLYVDEYMDAYQYIFPSNKLTKDIATNLAERWHRLGYC